MPLSHASWQDTVMQRSLDLSVDTVCSLPRQTLQLIRSQRRRLANFGIAGGASVIVALTALGMLALNARGLGGVQFGIFAAIQAGIALCGSICATESWQSLCRLGCARDCDLRFLCKQALALDAMAALAAFVLAIGGIYLAGPMLGIAAEYRDLAAIHAVSLLAGITGSARGYFRLKDRFAIIAVNQVVNGVLGLGIAAVLLWREAGLAHYIYAFTALAIAYKLQLLGMMVWHLREEKRGGHRYRFGQIARMSFGVSVLTTMINARRNIAILVVSAALGPAATGLFAAALKCTGPIARFGDTIKQVLFADVIRGFRSADIPASRMRKLRAATWAFLLLAAIGAAFIAFVAEPMLRLMLGSAFVAAAPILILLVLAEGVHLAATIFNPLLQARGAMRALIAIHAFALGCFVVGALIFGTALGSGGIAALFLASFVFAYLAQFALVFGPGRWSRMGKG